LNEQIEDAESFELIMDVKSTEKRETKPSSSKSEISVQENQVRELEHEICELVKQIEDLKKM
jgi:hypothetical protein